MSTPNRAYDLNQSHGAKGRAGPFANFEREGEEEEEIRKLIQIAQILDDQHLLFQDYGMDGPRAERLRGSGESVSTPMAATGFERRYSAASMPTPGQFSR